MNTRNVHTGVAAQYVAKTVTICMARSGPESFASSYADPYQRGWQSMILIVLHTGIWETAYEVRRHRRKYEVSLKDVDKTHPIL